LVPKESENRQVQQNFVRDSVFLSYFEAKFVGGEPKPRKRVQMVLGGKGPAAIANGGKEKIFERFISRDRTATYRIFGRKEDQAG
jgi:hypothetical protein